MMKVDWVDLNNTKIGGGGSGGLLWKLSHVDKFELKTYEKTLNERKFQVRLREVLQVSNESSVIGKN